MNSEGTPPFEPPERFDPGFLCVATRADSIRHVIVREALESHLVKDDKLLVLYRKWGRRIGIKATGADVWSVRDWLSFLYANHLQRESALLEKSAADRTLVDVAIILKAAEPYYHTAQEQMLSETMQFLRAVGLYWPWLASDLAGQRFSDWVLNACGLKTISRLEPRTTTPLPDGLRPPQHEFVPGESVEDAKGRLLHKLEEFFRPFVPPPGRLPSASERSALERGAQWLYLEKLQGRSRRSIAKQFFDGDTERQKDVRDCIKRALELLALNPYEFKEAS